MESFGWVIRQVFNEAGPKPAYQYLSSIHRPDEDDCETEFGFLNSQHNSKIFGNEEKDAVLRVLNARWPDSTFEAMQLFWQAT